jgi:gamma-glutamylputrescine oxidase
MRQRSAYDEEVANFLAPSCANANLTCQFLVVGGGLSGLSAAEAAMQRGLDVIVIEKGAFGKEAASGLNAGQFLTGWAKPVGTMLSELTRQEQEKGLSGDFAQSRATRRVRAFLRRTVEGCQRLADINHRYNLRASVQQGAVIAAMNEADMSILEEAYHFMQQSNFRALMPVVGERRPPFFRLLSARQLQKRCGTDENVYASGVIDYFGGSFRPRTLLLGLARALQKKGVRLYQDTDAQALDFPDNQVTVFCGNGATIRTNHLFMANAYARHINGDVRERTIFNYDYVVAVNLPERARILTSENVISDTRDPCFYARRHGRRFYMGFEETAETSPDITQAVARRTLDEGKRIFPALRPLGEHDITNAWSGAVYYTLDDYPFVERRHGGRMIMFAAPSDHGNALALRVGELVGDSVAHAIHRPQCDEAVQRRRYLEQQLRLFEAFPKGLRLRPGKRYQEAIP